MRRKTAMVFSGLFTAFVLVVVIGWLQVSGRAGNTAQAASLAAAPAQAALNSADPASSDVAALQAEVAAYRDQLQQAYTALQQAYEQIQLLQSSGNGFHRRSLGGERLLSPGLTRPSAPQQIQPFESESSNG